MFETVELRNKPELKIILNTDEFEIVDASGQKNNGTYPYAELKSVELNTERTNWLISTLSILFDLITGEGTARKYKDKSNLKLELANKNLQLWLNNADFKKAEETSVRIKNKKKLARLSSSGLG